VTFALGEVGGDLGVEGDPDPEQPTSPRVMGTNNRVIHKDFNIKFIIFSRCLFTLMVATTALYPLGGQTIYNSIMHGLGKKFRRNFNALT
jgi:hypothetical protein